MDKRFEDNDTSGNQKTDYLAKIAAMEDEALGDECYSMIYQSARCANSPRADWHWRVDACYAEAYKRDEKAPIYSRAYKRCYDDHIG